MKNKKYTMKKIVLMAVCILTLIGCTNQKNMEEGNSVAGDGRQETSSDTTFPVMDETTEDRTTGETEEATEDRATVETEEMTENRTTGETEDTTKTDVQAGTGSKVTMCFTGDIYFSDMLYQHYQNSGLTGFLSQSLVEQFQRADLMVCDHEYAATNLPDTYKADYQLYTFRAPVEREIIWRELGVDIVTLANNHTLDYGQQGLFDTFQALEDNGISYVGAGNTLNEAMQAEIRIVNGKKIAVLAASRFVPNTDWYADKNRAGLMTTYPETDRFEMVLQEITRLKEEEKCDAVIVFVHFGTEKTNQINDNQPVIAHGYIDAGADAVVGCHAHTLQGIEIYKDAPIFYNLGNFLFGSYNVDTIVANLTINEDNSVTASVTPAKSGGYYTEEVSGAEGQAVIDYMNQISVNVKLDEYGRISPAE